MTSTPPKHETSAPVPIPRRGISGFPCVFLHILLCLTAITVPLSAASAFGVGRLPSIAAEILSVAILVLLAVYLFRTGKLAGKTSRGLIPLLGFLALLLGYATQSAITATACVSLIFFIGEGAMLVATQSRKNAVWLPLIPLISLGLSLAITTRIDVALLCLLPLPATLALAFGTRSSAAKDTGMTRVGVICLTSLCLGLTTVCFGAWFLHRALGSLELSTLQALLDDLRSELTLSITQLEVKTTEGVVRPFEGKETLISDAVAMTFNLLPGAGVVLCNIAAALSQMVTLSGLTAFGFGKSVTDRVKAYRISAVSSFVFLVAWVVALIANAETVTLVGTVAENFTVILLPGLAMAGFLRLVTSAARKGCAPGCLILILVIFLSSVAFIFLAGYEAIAAVFGPLVAKLKPPKDQDPPFPPTSENDRDNSSGSSDDDNDQGGPSLF